jgi:hypothetical protein
LANIEKCHMLSFGLSTSFQLLALSSLRSLESSIEANKRYRQGRGRGGEKEEEEEVEKGKIKMDGHWRVLQDIFKGQLESGFCGMYHFWFAKIQSHDYWDSWER